MPHIIVVADGQTTPEAGAVMLRERITSGDLESQHFGVQLLERLEWAVGDAHEAEQTTPRAVTPQPSSPGQPAARVLTTAS
ncbi:MAG TPA: hypothetical protein VG405_08975 [Solirubrobacteraceae bacterium]|jgi:hypothetical protein|nr:hypothetical protein [Solirubrobacteraceae bacterium]